MLAAGADRFLKLKVWISGPTPTAPIPRRNFSLSGPVDELSTAVRLHNANTNFAKSVMTALTVAIDVVVATNSTDLALSCLEIVYKYFSNAAKPDEKFRKINKNNDIYQVSAGTHVS